jgi:hypothetical protein
MGFPPVAWIERLELNTNIVCAIKKLKVSHELFPKIIHIVEFDKLWLCAFESSIMFIR